MDDEVETRLETAFQRIVADGPERAFIALEQLRHGQPTLHARLQPIVESYVSRQRRKDAADTAPVDAAVLPDRFRIIRLLGSGGFGHVYHAVDTHYDAEVAVKVLHPRHASALRRFKDEFTHLSAIASHDNLVTLYEGFFDTNPWLFTMEYVEGVSLLAYVQQATAANRYYCIRSCLGQLAAAVHMLHLNKCHHRDLKPSNVLVTSAGCVKVIDFGLVREFGDRFEETVSLVGTLDYMSPEQLLQGTVTEASDWYAVGVMLYELLTGTKPHFGVAPLSSSEDRPEPPNRLSADAPADLSDLCVRLLAKDPRRRASYLDVVPVAQVSDPLTMTSHRDVIFVGREVERRQLMEYYEQSRERPILVHLSGPSGVGKTTLIRQVHAISDAQVQRR